MTSTTAPVTLGFHTSEQVPFSPQSPNMSPTTELFSQSDRMVTLIDLPGNHRYVRTALRGLTGYHPDVGLVVVSEDHRTGLPVHVQIGVLLGMGVRIVVVINKIDMLSPDTQAVTDMLGVLASLGLNGWEVTHSSQLDTFFEGDQSGVPVIPLSSYTGTNLHLLLHYMALLRPPIHHYSHHVELRIVKVFRGNKLIVGGTLRRYISHVMLGVSSPWGNSCMWVPLRTGYFTQSWSTVSTGGKCPAILSPR
ncbi:GTP-binding protein 2-like [Octopus sinensis]|uniref:GTP-binding protein 2-like n=1 Tax=Octopus sinensis TaxID=2607531 RepID=A0A6P7TZ45_9MOLL|nr:GTP-binding protein 2-like [Octopus sinensis]